MLWQFVIYHDVEYNAEYKYSNDPDNSYLLMKDIVILTSFVYIISLGQSLFLTIRYSRHLGCVSVIIHQFVFIYIWMILSHIETDGCKHREWLSMLLKISSIIVDNSGITHSKTLATYGIESLIALEIILVICSYIKNKNTLYYFYQGCFQEICAMILFHYVIAFIYMLLPLAIWFIWFFGACIKDCDGSNENNISLPNYIDGTSHRKNNKNQSQIDIESGLQSTNIDI